MVMPETTAVLAWPDVVVAFVLLVSQNAGPEGIAVVGQ